MKHRLIQLLAIGTILAAVPALAQTYNLQVLTPIPGTIVSTGTGLNDVGQACGNSEDNGGFATLFSDGQALELGSLVAGDDTSAVAIDDSGVVMGFEEINNTGPSHAVLWSNGTVQDITDPSLFPGGEEPFAIGKKSGVVVGLGIASNGDGHMFTYANGQTTDLGPATSPATPLAINDSGEILVDYLESSGATVPAVYANGAFTFINPPKNAALVTAHGINDNGVVAGGIYYSTNTAVPHAATYSNGAWTDLGILPGTGRGTVAWSINSSGQLLGMAIYTPVYKPDIGSRTVPCILQNGAWIDLNTLIPTNSTFYRSLSRPVSINDAGQILVSTKTPTTLSGYKDAVLLTPK